jgi:hypothetical protein
MDRSSYRRLGKKDPDVDASNHSQDRPDEACGFGTTTERAVRRR